MGDWFRSATVLVMAFVAAVAVTIGLANVIVPGGAADPQPAGASDDASGRRLPSSSRSRESAGISRSPAIGRAR